MIPVASASQSDKKAFILLTPRFRWRINAAIVALALANWCFVRTWSHLLLNGYRFYDDQPLTLADLFALTANILGFAVLFWFGIALWRRSRTGIPALVLELLFFSLLIIPIDFLRAEIFGQTDAEVIARIKNPLAMTLVVAALLFLLWQHRRVARVAAAVLAITSPVALWTLFKIILAGCNLTLIKTCSICALPPPLLPVNGDHPRVVWMIFDETDYRMAFAKRPPGLTLPEFDRLRDVSLSADHACAPADQTLVSMSSLIVGRRLAAVSRDGCDMALQMEDDRTTHDLSSLPSVFSQARELGVNTALVGWHVPYGRLLGGSLNYCSWYAMASHQMAGAAPWFDLLEHQIAAMAWPLRNRQIFINICQGSLKDALSVAGDPVYGLLLFHLPPPHAPGVYLPEKKKFTFMGIHRPKAYFNNLALADFELGELRRKMETSGQWDKSWIIVSADHSWRTSQCYDGVRDYRVPFLVKPPGAETSSVTYTTPFNTVLTHDFILAILNRQITNQSNAKAWLDAHIVPGQPVMPSKAVFEIE